MRLKLWSIFSRRTPSTSTYVDQAILLLPAIDIQQAKNIHQSSNALYRVNVLCSPISAYTILLKEIHTALLGNQHIQPRVINGDFIATSLPAWFLDQQGHYTFNEIDDLEAWGNQAYHYLTYIQTLLKKPQKNEADEYRLSIVSKLTQNILDITEILSEALKS